MATIFINLKRFDVPRSLGGICPQERPDRWIRWVIEKSVETGLGKDKKVQLVYLLPESLILPALEEMGRFSAEETAYITVGCQGVFRENVSPGGNFGAFTTNLPAAAAKTLGASWAIIGHSEERKDKIEVLEAYDDRVGEPGGARVKALRTVNELINQEVLRGLESGLDVLLCMGETADERGDGTFNEQRPRIKETLQSQVDIGLSGVKLYLDGRRIVVGYEPIWAIGPGKTPPRADYIEFVATYIKEAAQRTHGFTPDVVYGGGLKEENAGMIGNLPPIDGGLVALTKFTQPIGFDPNDLRVIVDKYMDKGGEK
jgi:triosephosphate isomerase